MNMRRPLFLFSILIASFILAISFVGAQAPFEKTRQAFSGIYDNFISPLFEFALGKSGTPELFFAKILLFVIMLCIIWSIVSRFPLFERGSTSGGIVAIAVSILGIRFIPDDWINGILLPYSALGVAITAFLPFVLFVYFVYGVMVSKMLQRVAWLFAFAVFIGLYYLRYNEIGSLATIYLIVSILSILSFLLNNQINRFIHKHKLESMTFRANEDIITGLRRQVVQLKADLAAGVVSPTQYHRKISELERTILDLSG